MAQSYFIWNGKDSRSMGVIMRRAAPLIRPEERVEHMTVPGYSGDLTLLQGQDIYNSYIQTVEISVREAWRVREVFRWLRGSGKVIFSSDPDKQQDARIIGAVTLERVSRNLDHWAGTVQFYCQPLKERTYPVTRTVTNASAPAPASETLMVDGDVPTLPRIVLTPSLTGVVVLSINGKGLAISNMTEDEAVVIDCQTNEVTSLDGTTGLTIYALGEFPTLVPGINTITGTGWASLTIDPRERFL